MAITQVNTPLEVYATTDAGFRIWGKAWTDTMYSLGFTQEYSNIDWTTVTMPTVASTYAGKRVYKFNDSLSSTREIYVSLEFGRIVLATPRVSFGIRMTVGTSHSSGTVTGGTITNYLSTWGSSADVGEIIGVKTDFGFALLSNIPFSTDQYQAALLVERVRKDGSASADGVLTFMCGSSVNSTSTAATAGLLTQVANYKANTVYAAAGNGSPMSALASTTDPSYDGETPVYQVHTFGGYDPYFGVICAAYNYGAAQIFTATVDGVSGKYRTLNGGAWDGTPQRFRQAFRIPD